MKRQPMFKENSLETFRTPGEVLLKTTLKMTKFWRTVSEMYAWGNLRLLHSIAQQCRSLQKPRYRLERSILSGEVLKWKQVYTKYHQFYCVSTSLQDFLLTFLDIFNI